MDGHVSGSARQPAVKGQPVVDPAGWYAEDMLKRTEWIHTFSEAELGDLLDAVAAVEARGTDIKDITRETFPLPVLGQVLDDIHDELRDGRGCRRR